ncbi:ribosome-associated translation inhibitor RaiA [Candidatus Uhrbacteria bacterium]|nr:ribosome-associated translation inhibitor RaiA [Candidatus Uhrbacteria bacterium]
MTININTRSMELTPAIKQYVEEKMQSLEKYLDSIRHIDVEVGLANGHHNKGDIYECKANVQVGGETFLVERDAEDLYKAIDKVKDHLRESLTQWKKKMEER